MKLIKLIAINPIVNFIFATLCCKIAGWTSFNNAYWLFIPFCCIVLNAITFSRGAKEFDEKGVCFLLSILIYIFIAVLGTFLLTHIDTVITYKEDAAIGDFFAFIFIQLFFVFVLIIGNAIGLFIINGDRATESIENYKHIDIMDSNELIEYSLLNIGLLKDVAKSLLKIDNKFGEYIIIKFGNEVLNEERMTIKLEWGGVAIFSSHIAPNETDINVLHEKKISSIFEDEIFVEITIREDCAIFLHRISLGHATQIICVPEEKMLNHDFKNFLGIYKCQKIEDGWYYCESR